MFEEVEINHFKLEKILKHTLTVTKSSALDSQLLPVEERTFAGTKAGFL